MLKGVHLVVPPFIRLKDCLYNHITEVVGSAKLIQQGSFNHVHASEDQQCP